MFVVGTNTVAPKIVLINQNYNRVAEEPIQVGQQDTPTKKLNRYVADHKKFQYQITTATKIVLKLHPTLFLVHTFPFRAIHHFFTKFSFPFTHLSFIMGSCSVLLKLLVKTPLFRREKQARPNLAVPIRWDGEREGGRGEKPDRPHSFSPHLRQAKCPLGKQVDDRKKRGRKKGEKKRWPAPVRAEMI